MNKGDIRLFVVSHIELDPIDYPEREIIYVGKLAQSKAEGGFLSDSIGDNISSLNYTYSECTAMYRIWKNVKSKYVGIEHYRRLFGFLGNIVSKDKIMEKIERSDFLIMVEFPLFKSMKSQFIAAHGSLYFDQLRRSIANVAPEYLPDFDHIMKGHHLAWCNMMVAKKETYDEYCSFLFSVLFDVEKHIEIPLDPYQKRIMGFMSERLLSVYLHHHKELRVKHSFVTFYNRYKYHE